MNDPEQQLSDSIRHEIHKQVELRVPAEDVAIVFDALWKEAQNGLNNILWLSEVAGWDDERISFSSIEYSMLYRLPQKVDDTYQAILKVRAREKRLAEWIRKPIGEQLFLIHEALTDK